MLAQLKFGKKNYIFFFWFLAFVTLLFRGVLPDNHIFLPFLFLFYIYYHRVNFNKVNYKICFIIAILNDIIMNNLIGFTMISIIITDSFLNKNRRFIAGHKNLIYFSGFLISAILFYSVITMLRRLVLHQNYQFTTVVLEIIIATIYYIPFHIAMDIILKKKMAK